MKRVIRRPSPAMVVAIVALISALGGTAIGAAFVTKKKAKKIAANQVNKLAPGLSVASAKTAETATNLADQSQQIRAWAYVNADGSLAAGKNVSIVNDGTGRRCIDVPFTPSTAVATVRGDSGGNLNSNIITALNDVALCPVGHRDVRVFTATSGADSNTGFSILIN
jgi:hypothetical protein